MTTIVAYTFEADMYCVGCTRERFGDATDDDLDPTVDREGNPMNPDCVPRRARSSTSAHRLGLRAPTDNALWSDCNSLGARKLAGNPG